MTSGRDRLDVVVGAVERLGDVLIFDLFPVVGELPDWEAGAHIDIFLDDDIVRQYSLCGRPGDRSRYRLGVLLDPQSRGGSKAIHDRVAVGAQLQIGVPRNLFALDTHPGRAVLIGGGIGVTPLIAMAHALEANGKDFLLYYVAREPVFAEALSAENFADKVVVIRDRGQPDDDKLVPVTVIEQAGLAANLSIYTCGPVGLMDAVVDAAVKAGVASDRIHKEAFAAQPIAGGESFEVLAAKSGVRVSVGADEAITTALARAGVKVAVNCEQGICGTCVVNLIEGEPEHRDEYLTEDERTDQIALCCSRSRSSLLVVDL